MSDFPVLKSGAVLQIPAVRSTTFSTDIVRFLDGTEQRFRDYAQPRHRWIVNLDRLDETEIQRIREFIRRQNGKVGIFSFTDPWDGTEYPHCSFEGTDITDTCGGPTRGRTSIIIRQNKS